MKDPTLKEDPNLKLPAAVRAAAKRSEDIFNEFRDKDPNAPKEGDDAPADEGKADEGKADEGKPAITEAPVVAAEPVKPIPQPKEVEDDESWEHKYNSEHGRNIRNQRQMQEMRDQITSLQNVIATMQQPAMTTEKSEPAPEDVLTADELNDYGEDFLKVVGKQARAELKPLIDGYKAEITRLRQQLDGVSNFVKSESNEKLLSRLDDGLPEWRKMNTDQAFLEWLALPDPYSGAIRHDMLKAAYAQGNPSRVLAFFNGFLAEKAAVAPGSLGPDTGAETVSKVPLKDLAAPGRAKAAAATTPPAEKPILTRAQIAAFYADVAAGKFRGRDDEKAQAENVIFEAQREGRIR